jgi:hypothetical protein
MPLNPNGNTGSSKPGKNTSFEKTQKDGAAVELPRHQ